MKSKSFFVLLVIILKQSFQKRVNDLDWHTKLISAGILSMIISQYIQFSLLFSNEEALVLKYAFAILSGLIILLILIMVLIKMLCKLIKVICKIFKKISGVKEI